MITNFKGVMPHASSRLVVLAIICFGFVTELSARLGEGQGQVEGRILRPDVGKLLSDRDMDNRELQTERRENPLASVSDYLPPGAKEGRYWKSAKHKQIGSESGWRVYVLYVSGRSVAECYHRVGEPLSEFEVNALLAMNQAGSVWTKSPLPETAGVGIKHTYALENGQFCATVKGNWLMIFTSQLGVYVGQQKAIADAEAERNKQEESRRRQQQAPESVDGF